MGIVNQIKDDIQGVSIYLRPPFTADLGIGKIRYERYIST